MSNKKVTSEKFTYENCTLPTIHLGPAGRRPAWAYDDDDAEIYKVMVAGAFEMERG